MDDNLIFLYFSFYLTSILTAVRSDDLLLYGQRAVPIRLQALLRLPARIAQSASAQRKHGGASQAHQEGGGVLLATGEERLQGMEGDADGGKETAGGRRRELVRGRGLMVTTGGGGGGGRKGKGTA